MAALSRKIGERLRIGDQVVIAVRTVRGQLVHLKVNTPESVAIWREESYQLPKDKNAKNVERIGVCTRLGQTVLGEICRIPSGAENPLHSELLPTMNVEPLRRCVRICNEDGLHLRAAALLSQVARTFPSEIRVTCGGRHADAKSVWELIGLAAEPGCELILEAGGSRSKEALDRLEDLVANQFQVSAKENSHEAL